MVNCYPTLAALVSTKTKCIKLIFIEKITFVPVAFLMALSIFAREGSFVVGSIFIPPSDSKSLKVLFKVIEKILREPLPIVLIDFNAHHSYWFDKDANKLGTELFDFLADKILQVTNNSQPTQ